MKLYSVQLSPYAAACRLAIYAKSLDVELLPPHGEDTKSPEYLAVNPLGKIPCLDTGTEQIPESSTINEYLEDRFPETPLLPQSAEERAKARLIVRFVDLYLYPGLIKIFQQFTPETANPEVAQAGVTEIATANGHIGRYLSPDGFARGPSVSLADCSLVPPLFFCAAMLPQFGGELSGPCADYLERVSGLAPVDRVVGELQQALAERMANA